MSSDELDSYEARPDRENSARIIREVSTFDDGEDASSCFPHHIDRSHTDTCCLGLFLVFLFGLAHIYSLARTDGNIAKLVHGFDWTGQICGVDSKVLHKPMLYWCSPDSGELRLHDGICVSECPKDSRTQHWCPAGASKAFHVSYHQNEDSQEVTIGVKRNITLKNDHPTREALGYCFPSEDLVLLQRILEQTAASSKLKQFFLAIHGALWNWKLLMSNALVCIAIGYCLLFVLEYWFKHLVYGIVVVVHVLCLACAATLFYVGAMPEHNFFGNYLSESDAQSAAWGTGIAVTVVWILFSLLCCYGQSALSQTIEIVQTSCRIIEEIPTLLLQPLIQSVIVACVSIFLLYGFAWVLSLGDAVPDDEPLHEGFVDISGIHRTIELTDWQWACVVYWLFGYIWICEIVNALGQYAIAHTVVIYTCVTKGERCPLLHSYYTGLVFHLGTLAFAGFIIGFLRTIAGILAFLARQARNEPGLHGAVVAALCCCCSTCFSCIERLMSLINDLTYTDIALKGTSYLTAVENVVMVASSNPITYASVNGATMVVRVLCVTIIGGGGCLLSYQAASSTTFHKDLDSVFTGASSMLATSHVLGPTIAAGIICVYIAYSFVVVFYQTANTLLYCVLIGCVSLQGTEQGVAIWNDNIKII